MGSKTLPDQGRQMSVGPGWEAFFRERSYSISSSCWAASMAARLSRICGSSYDFLRHIQQEQWIFPLDSRPAAPRAHAETNSSPPSWRRIVSVQLCSLLDSSGHLQESSRKHALLQAAYLPRRKMVIAHHFLTLSVLAIVPLPGVLSKFFLRGGRISFSHAYSKNEG